MPQEKEKKLTSVWYSFKIMFFCVSFFGEVKTDTKSCWISYFLKLVFSEQLFETFRRRKRKKTVFSFLGLCFLNS